MKKYNISKIYNGIEIEKNEEGKVELGFIWKRKLTLTSEKEKSFLDENLPVDMLGINITVFGDTNYNCDFPPLVCVNCILGGGIRAKRWKVQNFISSNNLHPMFFSSKTVNSFSYYPCFVEINPRHNEPPCAIALF